MKDILTNWRINTEEFNMLYKKFGQLCYYAAWQLANKNNKNNHQNDLEDFYQELVISLIKAGSYTKRQNYIESCFELIEKYAKEEQDIKLLNKLKNLWDNRTRHGANHQKFGSKQEKLLDNLLLKLVPTEQLPDKNKKLQINAKFSSYCKQIIWNQIRFMGKKITREKPIRVGTVSLSDFSYLGDTI